MCKSNAMAHRLFFLEMLRFTTQSQMHQRVILASADCH